MTKKRQKNGKSDENHDLDINHDVDKQLDESIDVADENQEINELKDKLLRSRAELENFKKNEFFKNSKSVQTCLNNLEFKDSKIFNML